MASLQGCVIALSGTFSGRTQQELEEEYIKPLGATLSKTVTKSITHLIATEADFSKPSLKVKQAWSHDVPIVKLSWLEDCLEQGTRLIEASYEFNSSSTPLAQSSVNTNVAPRKRAVITIDDSDDDQPTVPMKRKKATPANASSIQPQPASQLPAIVASRVSGFIAESKTKSDLTKGPTNVAKVASVVNIPLDETCPLAQYAVYIDGDGMIYDASLNQTNAGNNNNKFYRIQLLRNGSGDHKTWTRWGRVGERGQNKVLGDGSLHDAIRHFEHKFKDKSGLAWADRTAKPKSGKYTFVERSYAEDSEDDDAPRVVKAGEKLEPIESKLHPAVQSLMALIFNQEYFAATMIELNYDVDKLPLGKLSKLTITRGYQALKDLSALFDDPALAQTQYGTTFQDAAEELSNAFFSLIPHAFGRNRPPIINNLQMLKREIDMLDSLSDMKETASIMKKDTKSVDQMNALDQQFKGLNLSEMTPLKKNSTEFLELGNYFVDTRGQTHKLTYQVDQIFRIERQGETDRFKAGPFSGPPRDRRLLWHGSRCTNFGGILSQGLRIAPPEAPVTGYMFGKGIYLADMSSKSANYCVPQISNGHALLLLCEVELGKPIQMLTDASYTAGEDAKANGMSSTWGMGITGPSLWKDAEILHPTLKGVKMPDTRLKPGSTNVMNAYLQYNEYIAYDIAQVRLRYLFRVRMIPDYDSD
ncbi:PARP-domain-containing protein [Mollisia scopiformis]|uniref:Poly [ADP-ribose] polymerase n=1 Tax=Mollisia scopiformis TaxID=149040 RepID=A0A194XB18_MOLSC|nr:PARP-domain-containing protein [Mollisia scopiformis]KUJ16942.1 PARP-domain-containing protein [Mollisia scopiformis]